MTLDSWKRLVLDPCNRAAQRRNEAATRDAFQEIVNYITNNVENGKNQIIFFEVLTTAIGSATTLVKEVVLPGFTSTGREFTLYDYTPTLRFAPNFVAGHYGVGRCSPEISETALVVIEIEGMARYIDGTLATNMVSAVSGGLPVGSATANVANFWGAFPNIADPGATVTVQDRNNFAPNGKAGDRYLAIWDEQGQEYVLSNLDDEEVIFFKVKTTAIGDQFCVVDEILNPGESPEVLGREMVAYDYTPATHADPDKRRFSQNFVQGYYGCGRHAPDIGTDNLALVIIELEGKARFIDGTFAEDMSGGSASGNVTNYWGAYPNIHNPGTPVEIVDRNNFAASAKSGDKFLAVWDEQEQEYVLVSPSKECECGLAGEIEFVHVCDEIANDCCLWDGIIFRIDAENTETFCAPEYCVIPCWIYCYQGVVSGATFPLVAADENQHWCGFAKLVKKDHDCDGDIRHVYAVDCGDCDCECPREKIVVTIEAFHCVEEIVFNAFCVTDNPLNPSIPPEPGWWGEFSITGKYPMVGYSLVVDTFSHGGENHDEVIVVIGCNETSDPQTLAELCTISKVYVELADGSFLQYSGALTPILSGGNPQWGGTPTPITDGSGCQVFCNRTFHYGVYIKCENGDITTALLYHLYPEDDLDRVVDTCLGTEVPDANKYFSDVENHTSLYSSECCEFYDETTCDTLFGNAMNGASCSPTVPNTTPSVSFTNANPVAYHVMGGCEDTIEHHHGTLPICGASAVTDVVTFTYEWSGRDECKVVP